jgi:hypothetical protein
MTRKRSDVDGGAERSEN